ncbi:MAG TPA: cytochrome c peroxidase [Paracoccaceae bacterium]|nr:cytochrome c peroxidase [Paracoccaceae bacterium]
MRILLASLILTGLASLVAAEPVPEALRQQYRRPLDIPFPPGAPYGLQMATLGKALYFDPRLSGAQNMTCATCHNPSFGWEVPVERAVGAMATPLERQAPTILNVAWLPHFFWDGRAEDLEAQALGPMTSPAEMNGDLAVIVARLRAVPVYAQWFERLFPGRGITPETIVTAIATYERTVVSAWSPFDRWVEGDEGAISEAAKRGFRLFNGEAHCAECHAGWNFTDNAFHDTGVAGDDPGRARIAPYEPRSPHAFKTPGLRDTMRRAPYMHDGSFATMEEVIRHYLAGGIERSSRSPQLGPLALSETDIADLVAFLETLTAEPESVPSPELPTR